VLQVAAPGAGGMHPLASLLASLDLADEVIVAPAHDGADLVTCPGVSGDNLARVALAAFREALPEGPAPLEVWIEKRIPVAAGLGGGSADAAAVLRAANLLAGEPLDPSALRTVGARVGADVPAQVDPRGAVVTGIGEQVEPAGLPEMTIVLVPQPQGLATPDVYRELDRLGLHRERLDAARLHDLARSPLEEIASGVENDLQPAALSLRPELRPVLDALREAGALAAAVSGSGPTAFGLFGSKEEGERAARSLPDALVASTREPA
jgi:4-diphosphocytidyl-2-C-methyl-D-erythritol kinase